VTVEELGSNASSRRYFRHNGPQRTQVSKCPPVHSPFLLAIARLFGEATDPGWSMIGNQDRCKAMKWMAAGILLDGAAGDRAWVPAAPRLAMHAASIRTRIFTASLWRYGGLPHRFGAQVLRAQVHLSLPYCLAGAAPTRLLRRRVGLP
jgi:hypothetical protein